jgi:hypothetical protein
MKQITLEDEELNFLIEACQAVNIPGRMAEALAVLKQKLAAATTIVVLKEEVKEV